MTNTYSTGNPLGSSAVKDLYDNASNFDDFSLSQAPSFVDRLGKRRETISGMEVQFQEFLAASGFAYVGEYAAGLTLTSRSQYFVRAGVPYRLAQSTALPYTLTGDWAAEQSKFFAFSTDLILRQDLLSTDPNQGVSNVYGASRVVGSLSALKALTGAKSPAVFRQGYYQSGDGGHSLWRFDATRSDAANDIDIVLPVDGIGRYVLIHDGWVDVRIAGCKVDGVFNNSPLLQALLSRSVVAGFGVRQPAGTLRCTAQITVTMQGSQCFSYTGQGASASHLLFDGSVNGLTFRSDPNNWWLDITPSSGFRMDGVSIATTSANTGVGLLLNMGSKEGRPPKSSMLNDVEFRGTTSFDQCWATSCYLEDTSAVWFNHCRWLIGGAGNYVGIGVEILSSAIGTDPTTIHFDNCEAVYGDIWIRCNNRIEGVYLDNCSHIAGNIACYWNVTGESGFHVTGGHYSCRDFNFYLRGINDWTITGALLYPGNPSAGHTFYSVYVSNSGRWSIGGGTVMVGGGVGVEVGIVVDNSNTWGGLIDGVHFEGFSTNAVLLTSAASHVTVGANSYNGIGALPVSDLGAGNKVLNCYQDSLTTTLVGGTSVAVNVAVIAGALVAVPKSASLIGESGQPLIGFYNRDASTVNNLNFTLRSLDGTLPTATVRLGLSVP